MIDQILVNLFTTLMGVTVGTYLGTKIMKHELSKEITKYLLNDLPHLLELYSKDTECRRRVRAVIRSSLRELGEIIYEELKGTEDEQHSVETHKPADNSRAG